MRNRHFRIHHHEDAQHEAQDALILVMTSSWDFQDGGFRNDDFSSKIFVDFEIHIFPEFFN